jgi:sulfatase maturation enzyme AslB (radical SAM superfamily)
MGAHPPQSAAPLELEAIGLVLTADCNFRCRYCYQDRKAAGTMLWSVLRAGLDILLAARVDGQRAVSFLGGEPLLAYALIRRAIFYLARRQPSKLRLEPWLTTNGTLLDEHRLDFLLAHGFRINLSFDGVPAAQRYRAAGSYEGLDRLLSWLRDRHPRYLRTRIRVAVVAHPPALECLADSIEYLLQKRVEEITIAAAMGPQSWELRDIEALERQFARISEASRRHYELTGRVPVTLFRRTGPDPSRPFGRWCCGVTSARSPVVDVDGQVYPCVMLIRSCQTVAPPPMGRRLGLLSLGAIDDPELVNHVAALPQIARQMEIFARQDLKWSSYGQCRDCPSVGTCAICPVGSMKDPRVRHPLQVSDFQCAFNRVALEHRRRFPCQPPPTPPNAPLSF